MERNSFKIKPLEIEIYKLGECFICSEQCKRFVHYECAVAYLRHQELKQKELNIKSGN